MTEGQRDCLRMVLQHKSSKEIARDLGISPHTVDQRLKQAMRHLGASSRVEAAKRLAALEGQDEYQSLACQAPDIEDEAIPNPQPAATKGERADPPSPERENGNHASLQRTGWIVAIVAGAAIILAALFTALNALSEFTR
ncbi:MAG TPA: helix-turn-helix transcriptional regulator [Allosphingosinicella sp.]|nr:helix-turn-helix transcriptional regulator [Allosphingosinicella sp.]